MYIVRFVLPNILTYVLYKLTSPWPIGVTVEVLEGLSAWLHALFVL